MILTKANVHTLPLHLRPRAEKLLAEHPDAEHLYQHNNESFTTRYNPAAPPEAADEGDEGEEQEE